ncbi:purine-nucleoside phosphorylase [Nitrosophilus kaiyonis]|uniref:phosphorylase family protein n=1 Tax=Nitrosophilus kaiyonis TaxID=2930200 RepID=UPI00248F4A0A|nr:purine-nucleoside phosphorylase [Nitrosophilus kaiyonis]
MIICAGKNEYFSIAHPIGVGLIESSINLTRLALFDKPEFLLFIGTAGSYGKYNIFDIIESRGASQIELSFIDKNSYTPIDNVIVSEGLNVSHETLVNSSNYITTNSKYNDFFLKNGIGVENMEFFSVLSVAKEYEIPAGGIFAVTNYCDKDAHKNFINNQKKAMRILEEYVREKFGIKD